MVEGRMLTHYFTGPSRKGAVFHGWAGPIVEWPHKAAPKVEFGNWKQDPSTGAGTVTFECQPFQLCLYGANSKKMAPRDKFTHFAFAGLGVNGELRLQKLPDGTDARDIFEAGGWTPPLITDLIGLFSGLANLEFQFQLDEAVSIVKCGVEGYGMGLRPPRSEDSPSEKISYIETYLAATEKWREHFAGLSPVIRSFLDSYKKQRETRKGNAAATRKASFELAVSEMQAAGVIATPIRIAAWMMGHKEEIGEAISHEIKERARRLKKEHAAFFNIQ